MRLPVQLQRAMAAEAEAARDARAKVTVMLIISSWISGETVDRTRLHCTAMSPKVLNCRYFEVLFNNAHFCRQVIAAEGEKKASSALRAASEMITASPGALQLRYLQTLNSISAEKNSTIIFPVPLDIFSNFAKK